MDMHTTIFDTLRLFFAHVFGWMSLGLGVTAATAWYIFYQNPAVLVTLMSSPFLLIILFIVQLGLVFWLSSRILSLSFGSALAMFLLYAFLNGIVFSGIFVQYTQESIALTFGVACGMFAAMALFGYVTRINLSPIGVFGYMALWGLIISMLVNWYFQSETFNLVISGIGVLLFAALTAYDMQRLTALANQLQGRDDAQRQMALFGALMLYLDFINLFLMLLSFTGKRRD
jgi:FtsH-binding integral membrane protein